MGKIAVERLDWSSLINYRKEDRAENEIFVFFFLFIFLIEGLLFKFII